MHWDGKLLRYQCQNCGESGPPDHAPTECGNCGRPWPWDESRVEQEEDAQSDPGVPGKCERCQKVSSHGLQRCPTCKLKLCVDSCTAGGPMECMQCFGDDRKVGVDKVSADAKVPEARDIAGQR